MSPLNLHNLRERFPRFDLVWEIMEELPRGQWERGGFIDPSAVARELRMRRKDPLDAILAFNTLVSEGLLRQVYVLVNPRNGEVLSDASDSPVDLPETVEDFDERIRRDEADVLPVFLDMGA